MYRTSIRLPQRCTQRDNRNSLVFAPNARLRSFALASFNTALFYINRTHRTKEVSRSINIV